MGESDPRPGFGFLKQNLQSRIQRLVWEFRCPPRLNDTLIRLKPQSPAEDASIPGCKPSGYLPAHFCGAAWLAL